jgi:mannose-6-phosphate isomerase-like protein (cupin superfamily)
MAGRKAKRGAKPAARAKSTARKTTARKATRKVGAARRPKASKLVKPASGWAKQRFAVSHHREEDFDAGLRSYAEYRDLGLARATDGMVQAHVIRFVPPCRPEEVAKLHFHDVDFQMVYVLKGSITTEIEGQGAMTMKAGSCWTQPPRVRHKVLDYSDDCEVLEIILPAEFDTVMLEK